MSVFKLLLLGCGLLLINQFSLAHSTQPLARLLIEKNLKIVTPKVSIKNRPQVLIKVHVINIDHNYSHEFGIGFNVAAGSLASAGGFHMNLPTTDSDANRLTIPIAAFNQNIILEARLQALEKFGHAKLISDPQIVTLDKHTAIIEAGQEVPYQQATENGGTSVAFKKAVLRLQVTPEIQSTQSVLLHLTINQDQVSDLTINGVPAINTQQLKTQVYMKNHDTLVLGGVFQESKSDQHEGVPFLSKIPFLGILFRYRKQSDDQKQLLILVTPVIL